MQHLEGSGTPVLYIGRTVLNSIHFVLHFALFRTLQCPFLTELFFHSFLQSGTLICYPNIVVARILRVTPPWIGSPIAMD